MHCVDMSINAVLWSFVAICAQAGTPALGADRPGGPKLLRFNSVSIMDDAQHIGGEAYRILAPADWRTEGGILWKNVAGDPAAPWVRILGPSGQEIGVLPHVYFMGFTRWNMLANLARRGSLYNGAEVQPPVADPFQCIREIVIPRQRHHLAAARIVKQEQLPDLAAAARQMYLEMSENDTASRAAAAALGINWQQVTGSTQFTAGKIRFAYQDKGVDMEEDVYVVTSVAAPLGGIVTWGLDQIRYSKAPKGTLDAQVPLFQTAMFSLRPNLRWWAKQQRVSQILTEQANRASQAAWDQVHAQQAAAERMSAATRSVAQAGDQINDMIMKGYERRQASMDRVNERWDRIIRGVEVYHNPDTGENMELPSSYETGWRNKSGEVLLTDSVNFDPNREWNKGSWTRLEKKEP